MNCSDPRNVKPDNIALGVPDQAKQYCSLMPDEDIQKPNPNLEELLSLSILVHFRTYLHRKYTRTHTQILTTKASGNSRSD